VRPDRPLPAARPFRRAGIVVLDYAYALRRQLGGLFDRRRLHRGPADPGSVAPGTPHGIPVLLIPGVYETWRFLRPLARHLRSRGHDVHVVDGLRWNIASVEDGALAVTRYLAATAVPRVAIVAHSKGGLIAKRVLELRGDRVAVVVAVATPFGGSSLARFLPLPGVRSLGPAGADVAALARRTGTNRRIVSVAPWFDPHIPDGSRLEGARSVTLQTGGHFRVLSSPELFALVDEVLAEADT
jgi:pimeloyl-ACP methyl ester carboxylesterase